MIPTNKSWLGWLLFACTMFNASHSFGLKENMATYACWTLLSVPYLKDTYALTSNTYHKHAPVKPAVDTFVRGILHLHGCDEAIWQSVRIVYGDKFASDSIWNTIEVPLSEKFVYAMVHVYQCANFTCTECDRYRGIITKETFPTTLGAILHEAGHLVHKDLQKWTCATIITPIIIQYTLNKFSDYSTCSGFNIRIKSHTHKWQRILFQLLGTVLISDIILRLIKKHSEKAADQFAIDHIHNPATLTCIERDFLSDYTYKRDRLHPIKQQLFDYLPWLYEHTTGNHPSDISRAQHFRLAAQKLYEAYQ